MYAAPLKNAVKVLVAVVGILPQIAWATYPGKNGVIAYSHVEGPYEYGSEYHMIRVINPDGTGVRELLPDYYRFTWAGQWSADGKKLLYERGDLTPHEIWRIKSDGSDPKKVTTATCTVADPSWSPDGKKVIFQDCVDGNVEIYTIDEDGSNRQRLTNNLAWEGQVSWQGNRTKQGVDSA